MTDAQKAQIERINEISAIARTSWLALLGYLAFIGISLLAVEDADFFVPTRRTDLPLVGVAIPTHAFFLFAPILASALYVYLHLHLLKLWDTIADAPSTPDARPLGERLHPWIANDYALALKGSGALPLRPMRWLASLATRLLVWIAGPLILAGFWWRSMPAHDEMLTLAIAAALLVTLYAGFTSWWTLRARMRFPSFPADPWPTGYRRPAAIALTLSLVAASWLRTEGGLDYHANKLFAFAEDVTGVPWLEGCGLRDGWGRQVSGHPNPDCLVAPDQVREYRIARSPWVAKLDWFTLTHENWLAGIWLDEGETWNPLAPTDLGGVELVDLPEGWRTPETARAAFRNTWCEREGVSMTVCGPARLAGQADPPTLQAARVAWCNDFEGSSRQTCLAWLANLDAHFESAWAEERKLALANLPRLSLVGRDLRNALAYDASLVSADLAGVRLQRARLRGAWLEGANLREARLEDADLGDARLEGAVLVGARLDSAWLRDARLEGADLRQARLMWADLGKAQLQFADLSNSWLGDANLAYARLEGADLSGAWLERADLTGAVLEVTNLWGADLRDSDWFDAQVRATRVHLADMRGAHGLTQHMFDQLIGNEHTLLPENGQFKLVSCWTVLPDALVALARRTVGGWYSFAADNLCADGDPQPTGKGLALDALYPDGHPYRP